MYLIIINVNTVTAVIENCVIVLQFSYSYKRVVTK